MKKGLVWILACLLLLTAGSAWAEDEATLRGKLTQGRRISIISIMGITTATGQGRPLPW